MTFVTGMLRCFLYILLPVGLAWVGSRSLSMMFSAGSEQERQPLLLRPETTDPLSYDWERILRQEGSTSYSYESARIEANNPRSTNGKTNDVAVHAIVLVHGWLGNPLEMDSISQSLRHAIATNDVQDEDQESQTLRVEHRFVVHSVLCNEGKTTDGIDAGGTRLAAEINSLLRYIVDMNLDASSVSLSIVGNSLGGLYARRALPEIEWNLTTTTSTKQHQSNAKSISVVPMLFVTTATPHLGVSSHTYVKLPRFAEYPIATVLQQTGKDLFRFSSVLEELTFEDKYLQPLARFRKRIAYANVCGTDFQVPTATASFLALESDSPHQVVVSTAIDDDDKTSTPDSIVMTLETSQGQLESLQDHQARQELDPTKRYQEWSKQLDRLGWTKVLVDMREHIPQLSIFSSSRSDSSSASSDDSSKGSNKENNTRRNISCKSSNSGYNEKETWTSDELLKEFGSGLLERTTGESNEDLGTIRKFFSPPQLRFPLGHTVMVANAKDEVSSTKRSGLID
ncbi:MAG: hypothetical protein SGILL_006664 [Bacillariaceae sp.]